MGRVIGVVARTALAVALCWGMASAANSPFGATRFDLGSQLMLRLFGETSDASASFAAARGDRVSESPFRELALQVSRGERSPFVLDFVATSIASEPNSTRAPANADVSELAQALDAGLLRGDVHFSPSSQSREDAVTLIPSSALLTANYQPVAAAPAISPEPGALAFDTQPAAAQSTGFIPVTMRVGGVQFQGHAEGASSETPALSLRDSSGGAGANFQVQAGKRDINLSLTTQYEHLFRNDVNSFSSALDSTSSWQLPDANAPLVIPSYADLNRLSIGAGVAVPVVRGLTLNLNYGVQRLYGGYGLPGLVNLDAVNNSYGGKLTFNIPDASKTLSISAYQERFSDSVLPINGFTQTREDVNFTVKF